MRDEVIDFKSAVAEICHATLKPSTSCEYGHAKTKAEAKFVKETHIRELFQRAKLLTSEEIAESVSWVEMFHKPSEELARTVKAIHSLVNG